ncbi:MAG: hypothetical protein ACK5UQ_06005 [Planctomycetota bacterium]
MLEQQRDHRVERAAHDGVESALLAVAVARQRCEQDAPLRAGRGDDDEPTLRQLLDGFGVFFAEPNDQGRRPIRAESGRQVRMPARFLFASLLGCSPSGFTRIVLCGNAGREREEASESP